MATMTHRTTFALDESTAKRIRSLAALWKVSQAEVVRRVVSQADLPSKVVDPVAQLQQLHSGGGGMSSKMAEDYLTKIRKDRRQWRGE
jgi:hypothetical protein